MKMKPKQKLKKWNKFYIYIFLFCLLLLGIFPKYLGAEPKTFHGITEPYRSSTISATVPGRIQEIIRNEGDVVKKGETILILEKDEVELELSLSKLIADSKVELLSAQYKVNFLKQEYLATKSLYESTHSISEEEVLKKELSYKLAIAEYDGLKIAEKKEELEYQIAKERLNKRIIQAPFNGIVVKIHLKEGESCNALEPLVRIVDINKCRFITYMEASSSYSLSSGKEVFLKIKGNESSEVKGKIEYISHLVDPSSGLREVKVVFDNSLSKIQPGVSGTMFLRN